MRVWIKQPAYIDFDLYLYYPNTDLACASEKPSAGTPVAEEVKATADEATAGNWYIHVKQRVWKGKYEMTVTVT